MSRSSRITPNEIKKDRNTVFYSDVKTNFNVHPLTKELARAVDEEAIKIAVRNRILTNFGEVPYRPFYGSNINASLFEINDEGTYIMLQTLIEQCLQDEPRVRLTNVALDNYDTNTLNVTIMFYILNTQTESSVDVILKRVR